MRDLSTDREYQSSILKGVEDVLRKRKFIIPWGAKNRMEMFCRVGEKRRNAEEGVFQNKRLLEIDFIQIKRMASGGFNR